MKVQILAGGGGGGRCDCSWAKNGCGSNDRTRCWNVCCGKKRST